MKTRTRPAALQEAVDAAPSAWRRVLPELATDRLLLREPQPRDAADLVRALSNDDVGRFMSQPPSTLAAFEGFIAWVRGERLASRCFCYAIVPAATGRAAGLVQFRAVEPGFETAEWGFALSPDQWGTGLFMEAARVAVDFAFRVVGVHRLEARASVENGRGNGALRKLGAVPEGVLRESLAQPAGRVDQVLWGMLEEDWVPAPAPVVYRMEQPPLLQVAPDLLPPRTAAAPPAWCVRVPALESAKCLVREIEPGDVDDLRVMLSEPDVRRYTSPAPPTIDAFGRFVAWSRDQRALGRYACFAIVPASHGRAAGLIQLRALEPSFKTGEWGFALGRPFWATGTFHAAAGLVLDFAFGTIGAHRLEARTVVANQAAIRALLRLGAVFEGTLRRSFLIGGQYHDDALYALLGEDWRRHTAQRDREIA